MFPATRNLARDGRVHHDQPTILSRPEAGLAYYKLGLGRLQRLQPAFPCANGTPVDRHLQRYALALKPIHTSTVFDQVP